MLREIVESVNEGKKFNYTELEDAYVSNYAGDASIKREKKTGKFYYWNPLGSSYVEIKDISKVEKNTDRYKKVI